ncbi:putative alanine racemase-domain-containing protein [Fimicolochytrium jonesii]|uniref:putative alanine racemase-domain-containing protein n=1 Tax=Fimicolochytrium jonesii TaxID=1396493 RepID=UPI0022FDCE54|nr:putative alanine racemase-domain-containing protein [Fimicolochytrium jonesii]KAI8827287.1 putative alanine racemase-domain-containing protein [Fimicolochytrium jonesii]
MSPITSTDVVFKPLGVVEQILKEAQSSTETICSRFQQALATEGLLKQVPFLTTESAKTLCNGQLVRFRCMVQDNSFNPEEFLREVVYRDTATGAETRVSMLFRDAVPHRDGCTLVQPDMRSFDASWVGTKHPVYCVSIPAETEWARQGLDVNNSQEEDLAARVSNVTLDDKMGESKTPASEQTHPVLHESLHAKFPIPKDPHAIAALIKTYGDDPQFRLNDVIEVVGVLEHVPEPDMTEASTEGHGHLDFELPLDTIEQPAFGTMPRIHVVSHRMLSVSEANPAVSNGDAKVANVDVGAIREALLDALKQILLGDELAAEYLLLHLYSKIQYRGPDETPIGYLPLNICNLPNAIDSSSFVENLSNALSSLVARSHRISLMLNELNCEMWMVPEKNREAVENSEPAGSDGQQVEARTPAVDIGLAAGQLQLADGTCVLVDETALQDGTLNARGLTNLRQLKEVLETAKLPYLIPYGSDNLRKDVDYGFIIVSHGKSMFPVPCTVPLSPSASPSTTTIPFTLPESALTQARLLLAALRNAPTPAAPHEYGVIPDTLTDIIMRDYAASRAPDVPAPAQFDLVLRLEVSKLIARSMAKMQVDEACWVRAGELERGRCGRIGEMKREFEGRKKERGGEGVGEKKRGGPVASVDVDGKPGR